MPTAFGLTTACAATAPHDDGTAAVETDATGVHAAPRGCVTVTLTQKPTDTPD